MADSRPGFHRRMPSLRYGVTSLVARAEENINIAVFLLQESIWRQTTGVE